MNSDHTLTVRLAEDNLIVGERVRTIRLVKGRHTPVGARNGVVVPV